jgi:nucleoside 2-deoxyribosyltransferase
MAKQLEEMGLVKVLNASSEGHDIEISPYGWQRIAELENARAFEHSDKVFLAMWFNSDTEKYREAVRQAVDKAGYYTEEIAVDEVHHNDFIMNKVLNMIDDARFIIADYTCIQESDIDGNVSGGVRGGVYYEAGYAKGLGKEVIMTCKDSDDAKKRRHFDIDQMNTLFWDENNSKIVVKPSGGDFVDYLKQRIIATVGKGPRST